MERPGKLICFEGQDFSGKTTQASNVSEVLSASGIINEIQRFPNRKTKIGEIIHLHLTGETDVERHVLQLLFSANRYGKCTIEEGI